MCFSAPASFIASGGLAALGGVSLATAKKEDKILAAIPLLFAIQQGIEGFQWLYLYAGSSSAVLGYAFLFFAFLFWPTYVPTFVYILDKEKRALMRWFLVLGIGTSVCLLYFLLTQPLGVHELRSCVSYDVNLPHKGYIFLAYAVAVFGPLFASSRKFFKWFGVVTAVTALVAWLFYTFTFTSVWCFFAAIVSAMFFWYVKKKKT